MVQPFQLINLQQDRRGKRDKSANTRWPSRRRRRRHQDIFWRSSWERGAGANKRWARNKGALYPIRAGSVVRHH